MEKKRYFQIDFLKILFILMVICDHSFPYYLIAPTAPFFWQRYVIPIFLIILGFNMSLSFERKGVSSLKELYSKSYFKTKLIRFLIPYIVFYVASSFIFLIIHTIGFQLYVHPIYDNKILMLIGFTIFWGPGMWFIPIIFGSIFITPLLYYMFKKEPELGLLLCFVSDLTMTFIAYIIYGIIGLDVIAVFFAGFVLMYLSAIGIGIWFSKDLDLTSKRNKFVWILLPVSIIYVISTTYFGFYFGIFFLEYNVMYMAYPAFIFLVVMKYIPSKAQGKISNVIKKLSDSTYHLFLTQILYFSIIYHIFPDAVYTAGLVYSGLFIFFMIFNYAIIISVGYTWYEVERRIREKYALKKVSVTK